MGYHLLDLIKRFPLKELTIFLWMLPLAEVSAQTPQTVKGKVTSVQKEDLPGVNILVKGTTQGTVSDRDGLFSLSVPDPETVLVFSFIGYRPMEVKVNARSEINVQMEPDVVLLSEIVVVGYGTQLKREVTGAISSIKSADIQRIATADFGSALQGQLAGVSVTNTGGPGTNSTITIRGVSSFKAGGSEPLYVVDGVTYVSNPNISPNEIESIEVLKDGASASIYGTRASAGVILITTKKGKAGEMKVSLDSYYGVQKITSGINLASTSESLYIGELQARGQTTGVFNPLETAPNGLNYNTNWLKELTQDNAPMQNHSLTLSGGTGDLTYNIVGNLFDQKGTLINSAFTRKNVRANTRFKKGKFEVQTSIGLFNAFKNNEPYALQYQAIQQQPYRPGINLAQSSFTVPGSNPEVLGGFINILKQVNENKDNGYNGNVRFQFEVIKGLKIGANIGGSLSNSGQKYFKPTFIVKDELGVDIPNASNKISELANTTYQDIRSIQEYTITYKKSFADHNFNFLIGNTYEEANLRYTQVVGRNLLDNNTQVMGAAANIVSADERSSKNTIIGILGRVQYAYKSKYLFSASVRRDGSSKFGPLNKWGMFKSFSAGWNISDETFFKPLKGFLSDLKIRYGYGEAGSDRVGFGLGNVYADYVYAGVVAPKYDYVLGRESSDRTANGTTQPGFADQGIKWETNISNNLGFEFQFLNGKLNLTTEFYKSEKKDMLLAVELPSSDGVSGNYTSVYQNVGNMENKGVELTLGVNQQIGGLKINVSGVFTKNANQVISLAKTLESIPGGRPVIGRESEPTTFLRPGYVAGAFFLIPTQGVIQTDEQLTAYKKLVADARKGDLMYTDVNGNGVIDQGDRVYAGSGTPEWEAGLNVNLSYKNFDFTVQLFGTYGAKIFNGSRQYAYLSKRSQELVYAWSPQNPTSNIPTPRTEIEHNNVRSFSDYFLENGDYMRIRNITLGYSFPSGLLQKAGITRARIYFSAQNPITFTKYTGFTPEIGSQDVFYRGVDQGNYPISAVYRTGLLIEF
jgi:TonB-dependent starch-binding outer membrane protein SusC